jgi:glutathionyl-hydroquinone reductase
MGMLVQGVWHDVWYDTRKTDGTFVRVDSAFRDRVTADGSSGFRAEPRRYHLYVSLACPWAHRTLIIRALKGLESILPISVVDPFMGAKGWTFTNGPGCIPDTVNGATRLYELYVRTKADYTGRVTVPVLWDVKTGRIVNNESSEIVRMLNREFDSFATRRVPDLYPDSLRADIERWNTRIYHTVNNGVYRSGFATTQEKYEEAVTELFDTFDVLEQHLAAHRYLCGSQITEADWRLFPTLVRFDAVYHGHFKCNLRRLIDYPRLWAYTRDLYQVPGVAATVNLSHIKEHYYRSHESINPTRIVPKGPLLDFTTPHGRERL